MDLSEADLSGDQDLSKVDRRKTDLSEVNLNSANLSSVTLWGADLSGANLIEANLSGAELRGVQLFGANLQLADLSNTRSWIYARWNSRSKFRAKLPSDRKTMFGGNDIRNASWAGMALLRRYVEDENFLYEYNQQDFPWWRRILRFLWRWTCDYGRSFSRWVFLSFMLAFFFGGLYAGHPTWFHQDMGPLSPWYFSVVTFTTLGFGDLTPKPECWQAQAWVMAEVS